jgi:hypothetical protein
MTLSQFEGRDVVDTKMKVTNAGDGLSDAMEVINADELRLRQTVQVLLECEVSKITFEDASEGDGVIRIPTLRAGRATLITADHELHAATVGALNVVTEALARAGHAKGSTPGQTTVEGQLAEVEAADGERGDVLDEEWEDSARTPRPRPEGDSVTVPDDISSLDNELG